MDNQKQKTYIIQQHVAGGILIGIVLISIVLITRLTFGYEDFVEILKNTISHPAYIIIYLSPFLLGIYNYQITKHYHKKIKELKETLGNEYNKTKRINDFIQKLKNGQTTSEYQLHDEKDIIGHSLLELRDHLIKTQKEEQQRKQEDIQRSWVNEGLAKFGQILRQEIDNIRSLSDNVLINLVRYINANQGGVFILNDKDDEDTYFEMTAQYAYERKKFADKKVSWGEGLIGTCAIEKETIYLEEIPGSYVNSTSGLGKATPSSLLIVPLKINNEVFGIIEIASFEKYQKYQIEFIERVAESMASTISNVKINEKTAKLLEESREQAKTLAENEEQMRQNMEELQAAQEEAARQSEKFVEFTNTVNHTLIRAEYSTDGTLLYANTNFLKKLGYSSNAEVEGQHISLFLNDRDKDWFFKIWDNLSQGGKHFEGNMKHLTKQGKDLWTMATYTCMRRGDGSIEKILFLGLDITEQKQQSLDYEGQLDALNKASIKAEFTVEGEFIDCNTHFLHALNYENITEIEEKAIDDFIDRSILKEFKEGWSQVLSGDYYQGVLKFLDNNSENKWFRLTLSPVEDMYGEIAKVIVLAQDITKEKMMELETQQQTEQLKKQEEQLRLNEVELNRKLDKAKRDMREQFKEIEKIKLRNERTLEGALDAIITIDQKGYIEFFNQAAEELFEISKTDALGSNAEILFPEKTKMNDEFVMRFLNPEEDKIIGERREVNIIRKSGEEVPVLFLLSDAEVGNEHSYTAFIQKIEVELF